MRPRSEDLFEVERLDVKPEYRWAGLGRELAGKIVKLGIKIYIQKMYLDMFSSVHSAVGLYKSLVFVVTSPYYDNLHPDVLFFEKILDDQVNS